MLRLAVLLTLLAGPVLAESDVRWGIPLERSGGPNELSLTRCDGGACFAQVTFHNSQLRGMALTRSFALDLDGLSVGVTVIDGELRAPEQVVVTAPPGFYAEPSTLMVGEDTAGTVQIMAMPMS
jgi:hypothetical protein